MTLSLYIARRFAFMFAAVFAIFFGLMMLIDIVEQMRRLADSAVSFGQAAGLAALNVPASLYRILPLIMILSSIALFLGAGAVERTGGGAGRRAIRRCGFWWRRLPVAILIGVLAVMVLNPLVAATSKQYDDLTSRYVRGEESVLSVSPEGLWLRQGGAGGQTVIRAARANLDGTNALRGVTSWASHPRADR